MSKVHESQNNAAPVADVDSESDDLPALVQQATTPLQKPQTAPPSAPTNNSTSPSSSGDLSQSRAAAESHSATSVKPAKDAEAAQEGRVSSAGGSATTHHASKDTAAAAVEKKNRRDELEATVRAQVAALAQQKGDAGVQQMLQQQIQITKKKESEIATAKKRADQAAAELEAKQLVYKKLVQKKTTVEMNILELESDMTRQDDQVTRALREMENNRESIREKVQRDVDELHEKMKAMAETDGPLEIENEALRAQCATLKAEFDAAFAAYEQDWKQREADSSSLVQSLQLLLQETELLEATLLLRKREATTLANATKSYQMQCEAFEERVTSFEEVAVKSEDIERTAGMQREKLKKRLQDLEEDKKKVHEQRVQFEKEALALKGRAAAAKKKLLALEKQKMTLEQKCRKAQEKK